MKRISKKIRKQIMAVMLALAMAVGVTAGVKVVMDSSFADELGKFDPVFYAAAYPDVAAALGTDANVLYSHYQNYGQKEGRVPYAGAAAGEAVDGIAGTADTTAAPVAQTPTIDMNKTYYDSNGIPMDAAAFLQRMQAMQQEFDASEYAKVGWTEEQVYERLMWIKGNLYPEGTKVGICMVGAGKIETALYGDSVDDWLIGFDENGDAIYPEGFVGLKGMRRYSNYVYHAEVDRWVKEPVNLRDVLKVGDTLYTVGASKSGHVSVVLSRDDYGITVVESNYDGDEAMHWGDRISWNELENGGDTIYKAQNKWTKLNHRIY